MCITLCIICVYVYNFLKIVNNFVDNYLHC
nr:MAG TPA: hypothetical protein [Caudoviricetes sp.]